MALMPVCKSCSFGCHFLHALALSRTLLAVHFPFQAVEDVLQAFQLRIGLCEQSGNGLFVAIG